MRRVAHPTDRRTTLVRDHRRRPPGRRRRHRRGHRGRPRRRRSRAERDVEQLTACSASCATAAATSPPDASLRSGHADRAGRQGLDLGARARCARSAASTPATSTGTTGRPHRARPPTPGGRSSQRADVRRPTRRRAPGRRSSTPATCGTCTASTPVASARMLAEDDPALRELGPGRHRDRGRATREQDPATVAASWPAAGDDPRRRCSRGVDGDGWERTGRRSDGASFTIDSIGRYYLHDIEHHLWDVDRVVASSGAERMTRSGAWPRSSRSTSSGSSRATPAPAGPWSTACGGAWPPASCTPTTTCPRT